MNTSVWKQISEQLFHQTSRCSSTTPTLRNMPTEPDERPKITDGPTETTTIDPHAAIPLKTGKGARHNSFRNMSKSVKRRVKKSRLVRLLGRVQRKIIKRKKKKKMEGGSRDGGEREEGGGGEEEQQIAVAVGAGERTEESEGPGSTVGAAVALPIHDDPPPPQSRDGDDGRGEIDESHIGGVAEISGNGDLQRNPCVPAMLHSSDLEKSKATVGEIDDNHIRSVQELAKYMASVGEETRKMNDKGRVRQSGGGERNGAKVIRVPLSM